MIDVDQMQAAEWMNRRVSALTRCLLHFFRGSSR